METFQRHLTTSAFRLAGGLEEDKSNTGQLKQNQVPSQYVKKITRSFLDALYAFLDGLVHLSSEDSTVEQLALGGMGVGVGQGGVGGSAALVMEQNGTGNAQNEAYIQPLNLQDSVRCCLTRG
jgi:exocyst complex component 2